MKPRLKACVENWPDCVEGEYNPACCRFPKSCSCDIYPEDTPKNLLEEIDEPEVVSEYPFTPREFLEDIQAAQRAYERVVEMSRIINNEFTDEQRAKFIKELNG